MGLQRDVDPPAPVGQRLHRCLYHLPRGCPQLNRDGGLGRDGRDSDHVVIPIKRELLRIELEALPPRLDPEDASLLPVAEDRDVEHLPEFAGLLPQEDRISCRQSECLLRSLFGRRADAARPAAVEPRHRSDRNGKQGVSHDNSSRRHAGAAQRGASHTDHGADSSLAKRDGRILGKADNRGDYASAKRPLQEARGRWILSSGAGSCEHAPEVSCGRAIRKAAILPWPEPIGRPQNPMTVDEGLPRPSPPVHASPR